MERISVFDMFKIGVGPSSSHTLGPWRAAEQWVNSLIETQVFNQIQTITVYLYGSLAKTGVGHGTDIAVVMGLLGENPENIDTTTIHPKIQQIKKQKQLLLNQQKNIDFDFKKNIVFLFHETLPFHANALRFRAELKDGLLKEAIFYSIGGGFVIEQGEQNKTKKQETILPFPCDNTNDLLRYCRKSQFSIAEMVWENELVWRSPKEIRNGLLRIWQTMLESLYRGCHTAGILPGGLNVKRRAKYLHDKLIKDTSYTNLDEWITTIKNTPTFFDSVLSWVSCFAFAVNEENAAFGRIVTAPTNGAAGVIPTVLMYYITLSGQEVKDDDIIKFLSIAGEIGTFFKKGATISAAMGGCQAEIGVSSAMAAAALTECLGGSVEQALMAAEIAMEHHLGLTCDPIGGLVQIPCIERNSMGAIKAITATRIALGSGVKFAKVSLDNVIKTMWETAQDMNGKYKETSEGGLATNVNLVEC